ncbi:MAG: helix-turn-helix domain-containing protein [Pseudomonadota bacterium]
MDDMKLTKEIVKAARGLIGFSALQLAEASGVALDTVKSFESGRNKSLSADNQDRVQKALELAGVQFLESGATSDGDGVALRTGEP